MYHSLQLFLLSMHAGFAVTVAAGNNAADACTYSPARVSEVRLSLFHPKGVYWAGSCHLVTSGSVTW